MIDDQQLRQRVRELPALPQAAMAALAALRDEHTSSDRCAELIGRDQALAARVLRLANSAFYGVPGRVGSIRDAVHLLGRRTLGSVLTVATLSQQFQPSACTAFSFAGFWRHSIGVALASRGLARALDADDDLAFTMGLLHDIGHLALAVHFPDAATVVMAQVRDSDSSWPDVEHSVLGTGHAHVGALVAAHWQFPHDVVAAIAGHHAPERGSAAATLVDAVHVADALVHALDLAQDPHDMVPAVDAAAWDRLGLPQRAVLQVFADTERGVTELCNVLGLR